ncbi:TPA: helix-turn-helix domain-containing protein [Providencia rettgeri]
MTENKFGNVVLGSFIKKKRLEHQITIREITGMISIKESLYLKYEKGSISIFIDHLVALALILNVDLRELFDIYLSAEIKS